MLLINVSIIFFVHHLPREHDKWYKCWAIIAKLAQYLYDHKISVKTDNGSSCRTINTRVVGLYILKSLVYPDRLIKAIIILCGPSFSCFYDPLLYSVFCSIAIPTDQNILIAVIFSFHFYLIYCHNCLNKQEWCLGISCLWCRPCCQQCLPAALSSIFLET